MSIATRPRLALVFTGADYGLGRVVLQRGKLQGAASSRKGLVVARLHQGNLSPLEGSFGSCEGRRFDFEV
ncbi:MAG: hypothetical protein ACK2T2_10895 [Anaerolineales bacterium]